VSHALALALSASSRGVAHAPSSGMSWDTSCMLHMRADMRSADAVAADGTAGARAG
jgi:hypothetical protein